MLQMKNKENNQWIRRRRRRLVIKRTILILIMMISLLITMCFKSTYFNIKSFKVENNRNVPKDEVIKLSKLSPGNNIFYANVKTIEENILFNPYIASVDIKRKLPDTLIFTVKERDAAYYALKDKSFLVIDKSGVLLQEREEIKDMKLIKLDGFDCSSLKVGKALDISDKRKADTISTIADLVIGKNLSFPITSLDIASMVDIKIYSENICIKLGNNDNLKEKLNAAINVLERKELKNAKGYIDVSFNGNPVFFIEK